VTRDLNRLRRQAQAEPGNLEVQLELVQAWLEQGKAAQALDQAGKVAQANPTSGWACYWMAQCRLALQDWAMALEDLRKALALEPEEAAFWQELGRILLQRGDAEAALQAWQESLKLGLPQSSIAMPLGLTLVVLQRFDEAVALWEQAPGSLGQDAAAWDAYGLALGHQHRFSEALQAATKAVELAPQEASYWNNLANLHLGVQQVEPAQTAYQAALNLLPDHREALFNLADLKLQFAGPGEAIPLLQRLLALQPDDEEAWSLLAAAQEALDPKEAIRSFERLFQQGGGNLEQRLKLANLYAQFGQVQKELIFRQLLQQQAPQNPINALGLGRLHLRQGRLQAAFDLFRKSASPLAQDWFHLSQAFQVRGERTKELDCLEAALKQDAHHGLAWARLARITLQRGLPERALQLWGRSGFPLEPDLAWDLYRALAQEQAWQPALQCLEALLPYLALAPQGWRKIWRSLQVKGETNRFLAWVDRLINRQTSPPALRLGLASFFLGRGEAALACQMAEGQFQGAPPSLAMAVLVAAAWQRGDVEGAIEIARKADQAAAWLELGKRACLAGDWPLAEAALEQAPTPGLPDQGLLSAWLKWGKGERSAALADLELVCRQFPWRGDFAARLAAWQHALGQAEAAQATLHQALAKQRREPELFKLQATWAGEQGQIAKARLALGRALALAPQDPELRRLRGWLCSRRV